MNIRIVCFLTFIISFGTTIELHADDIPGCTGPNENLIALIDRPSVAFSPCTTPNKTVIVESGYDYYQYIPTGFAHYLPQMEIRIGLPKNTEFSIFPPSYLRQFNESAAGFGVSGVGLKHLAYYDEHHLFTIQGYIIPPSGGRNFGTRSTNFLLNGIYNYNFDSGIGISTTFGLVSQSEPPVNGNATYYSVDPIALISFPVTKKLNTYLEFYSQSATAYNEGWGVSYDIGVVLLAAQNVTLDMVYGHSLSGSLNGIRRYFGGGMVIHFT